MTEYVYYYSSNEQVSGVFCLTRRDVEQGDCKIQNTFSFGKINVDFDSEGRFVGIEIWEDAETVIAPPYRKNGMENKGVISVDTDEEKNVSMIEVLREKGVLR